MKASDRAVIAGVVVAVFALGFFLMVLSPKRNQASKLNTQIEGLNASIAQEQQVAGFAEQARRNFPRYYGRLVVLGKAVPEQSDTASMLVQLNSIAGKSSMQLRAIKLSAGSGGEGATAAAPATPPAAATPAPTATTPSTGTTPATPPPATGPSSSSASASAPASSTGATSAASTLVPATESDAASLPIGAVVGGAGLPTMPYDLTLTGGFFDVAGFIGGVDDLVTPNGASQISADGRLMTVDGFALNLLTTGSNPKLTADVSVTTYVAPATQGLTAGASPTGPAPTSPTQPASATTAVAQ
jgi:Tfp pilus assembly protein PilO